MKFVDLAAILQKKLITVGLCVRNRTSKISKKNLPVLAQAKIIKKSVILFRLLNMTR